MITWRETICKCGCGLNITSKFHNLINDFREAYGKPMVVLSGARCHTHNFNSGGSARSAHVEGRACDFQQTPSLMLFCSETNLEKYGLYLEDPTYTEGWLHLTDRPPASGKRVFKP